MATKTYPGRRGVGIEWISTYVPKPRMPAQTLAESRKKDANKHFIKGLGVTSFSVPNADEDIVTLMSNAEIKLYNETGLRPQDITGQRYTATESSYCNTTPVGALMVRPLEMYFGPDTVTQGSDEMKFACQSGWRAVLRAVNEIYASDDPNMRSVVTMGDIAEYPFESAGEPTSGAYSVSMLIGRNPIISLDPRLSAEYTLWSHEFTKLRIPLGDNRVTGSTMPEVDGHHSQYNYTLTTGRGYVKLEKKFKAMGLPSPMELADFIVVHLPHSSMNLRQGASLQVHHYRVNLPDQYPTLVAEAVASYNAQVDAREEKGPKICGEPKLDGLTSQHEALNVVRRLGQLKKQLEHEHPNIQEVLHLLQALVKYGITEKSVTEAVAKLEADSGSMNREQIIEALKPVEAEVKTFLTHYESFRKGVVSTQRFKQEFGYLDPLTLEIKIPGKGVYSMVFSAMLGNGYSSAIGMGTYSTLWYSGDGVDKNILHVPYGSGSGTNPSLGVIEEPVHDFLRHTSPRNITEGTVPLSIQQYERLHRHRETVGPVKPEYILAEDNPDKVVTLQNIRGNGWREYGVRRR